MSDLQPPARRPWWALTAALAFLAMAGWLLVAGPGSGRQPHDTGMPPMMAVAPGGHVELSSLSVEHQTLYRAAAADPDLFAAVPCYCGCEAFLEHRHLLDCFVRPDGGWERHATGCAVCLAEARDVTDLRDGGMHPDRIVKDINARYGGIAEPTT